MNTKTSDPAGTGRPAPEDVEKSVARVIRSGVLGKSDRRADLLRYIVGQELTGRGTDLKAFSIAIDVLGRDASFDASTDSIVRSEVGRLREALRLYFAETAHADQIRIDIPKGTYRPVFSVPQEHRKSGRAGLSVPAKFLGLVALIAMTVAGVIYLVAGSDRSTDSRNNVSLSDVPYEVVRIAVDHFEGTGANPDAQKLAFGVYAELIMDLSVYPWISVISPIDRRDDTGANNADYILSGDVFWENGTLTTHARLVAVPGEDVIWSSTDTLNATSDAIRKAVTDVSGQIASKLGSTHGIAPQLARSRSAQVSLEGLDAFLCYLGLHQYLVAPTDQYHLHLRACLTAAVDAFPTFGDAWAALSIIYMDEERFERNPRADSDPWQDAGTAIAEALKYAPTRMPTLNAALIHSIEAPSRDLEEFDRFSALLINLFPRHAPTQFNVGSRMAEFAGQWDTGLDLVEQAIELEPNPPTSFFITRAYNAARAGTDKDALFSVRLLTTRTSKSELLLNYLAASRNNLPDDMKKYRGLLAEEGLGADEVIVAHVLGRRYAPGLEAAMLGQLDAAFRSETVQ